MITKHYPIFTTNEVCATLNIPYWKLHYAELNNKLPFKAKRFRNGKRYFDRDEVELVSKYFGLK